jgi:multiple sugar transport system substrate-binding protein
MRSKIVTLLAVFLTLSFVLTACGTTPAATEAASTEASSESATEAATVAPTLNLKPTPTLKAGQTQVRWFIGLGTGTDPDQLDAEQKVVDEFNATHPDILLTMEIVTYTSAFDTLATEIASGNAPDIVGPVGVDGAESFHGQWLDLSDLISKNNYDLSQYSEGAVNFYMDKNEGQIGIPFASYPSVMYYNKALFDEAGLNYPPHKYGEPYIWADGTTSPWDYDTVRKLSMILTVDKNGNDATSPDFDPSNIVQYGYVPQYQDARAMGSYFGAGSLVAADGKTAQVPDAWKAAWKWIYNGEFTDHFIPDWTTIQSSEWGAGDTFGSGRIGMALTHTWYASEISLENWDMAVVPSYNGNTTANFNADTFRILKGSKNPDAAFTVLTYLLGDASLDLLKIYGGMPARIADQKDFIQTATDQYSWKPDYQVAADGIAYADNPSFEGYMPNYLESRDRVVNEFTTSLQSTEGLDMDKEIAKLISDLQVIYDKSK